MSNQYYTPTGNPAAASRGLSASMRAEFALLQQGLDKLPTPANLNGGASNLGTDSGSANAYVVAMSAQVTALFAGLTVRFIASASNTGASTLNVNSLGALPIVRPTGAVLAAGDILQGQVVELAYSVANNNWQLAFSGTQASPASFSGVAAGTVDLLAGAAIASAATINLNSATGNLVHITGTTAITAVTLTRGPRWVVFDGALTLTHHATNNNLPGGSNITTAAGDRALYWSDGTTVYCLAYLPASGRQVTPIGDHAVVVTGGNGMGGTNTTIGRYTTTQSNTGTDITYADSAANGASFTINASGLYVVSASTVTSGETCGASINSNQLTTNVNSIAVSNRLCHFSAPTANAGGTATAVIRCAAGDIIRPHHQTTTVNTAASNFFSVRKVGL